MGIFGFLVRKQREVEELVSEYLDEWYECLKEFRSATQVYSDKGLGEDFLFLVERTHRRESRADDLRRKIAYRMYDKALLPESRGDIMLFLDGIDVVINRAETTLYILSNECIELPEAYADGFRKLLAKTVESTDVLHNMARQIFSHDQDLFSMAREIDRKESECDFIERELIRKIFEAQDLDPVKMITFRDLILKIGDISDQAEKVADGMIIMSVKRKV